MGATNKPATIAAMEGAEIHADWLAAGAATPVDPRVSEPLSRAAAIPATAYIRAIRRRTALVAAMDVRLASVDVLALPTTPITAPTITSVTGNEALCERTEDLLLRNTQIANRLFVSRSTVKFPRAASHRAALRKSAISHRL